MFLSVVVPVSSADLPAGERLKAELAGDPRIEVIVAPPPPLGRGAQMNAGATRAGGAWLLFLHADSRLPDRWVDALQSATRTPGVVGGWFRFGIDAPNWQARAIEGLVSLRVRLFRLPYGDQGVFVRRDVFEALGGYREWPLMEDVDFVRRLGRTGRAIELPQTLLTSPRRWLRDGWFRRSARNLALLGLYACGVPPARLARWY